MAARNSSSSFKLWSLCNYRNISGFSWRAYQSRHPLWSGGSNRGLSFIGAKSKLEMGIDHIDEGGQVQQPLTTPTKFDFASWTKWLVGSIITMLLPFWKNKWDNLLRLEGKVEKIVKDVDLVEKVATITDEALKEVANQLPDNSELKAAAQVMEHVASVTAEEAKLIENVINKVGDVKQDLEELETIVEPIIEHIIRREHPTQ